MSHANRSSFLEELKKLCEEHRCYIETGFRQPLYIMEWQYPVDENYEKMVEKLEADL